MKATFTRMIGGMRLAGPVGVKAGGMEQREIMQRSVGILTEALEMRRRLRADPDADVTAGSAVAGLLEDMLPRIQLPADASARAARASASRPSPKPR